ncbi:uncharacterized protein LOC131302546 [Rhododendron vialii]|uniref:uncharacterized protein LOC131302546 n=1 Tax=Rhododendron vialii TaxID=182163 RepID=UPI00265E16ED|nr:uncharacterized protein LOC131302546 [Rhododendron vialii]
MSDVDPSRPWAWSWHMFDRGVLPNIFEQTTEHGQCGCCSMVATSAACSAAWAIKTARPPLDLAVQELINEVPKHYWDEVTVNPNDPCASAYTSTSFKYIKRFHIGMAGDLPYEGRPNDAELPPNCRKLAIDNFTVFNNRTPEENSRHINNWVQVPNVRIPVMMERLYRRPLVGEFHMFPQHFEQMQDGIYSNRTRDPHNVELKPIAHAILVVGMGHGPFGRDPYYICQNSFGSDWGLNGGYVRISDEEFFNFYDVKVSDVVNTGVQVIYLHQFFLRKLNRSPVT